MRKTYHVIGNIGYIAGHLRAGHYEAIYVLTEKEIEELKANPSLLREWGGDIIIDDYEIDDIGPITDIQIKEINY